MENLNLDRNLYQEMSEKYNNQSLVDTSWENVAPLIAGKGLSVGSIEGHIIIENYYKKVFGY